MDTASFVSGLFVGTFWLVVVLFLGSMTIAYVRSRFDP